MTDDLVQRLRNYKKDLTEQKDRITGIYDARGQRHGREIDAYNFSLDKLKHHAPELFEEPENSDKEPETAQQ